jgi:transcriptional regulator with XRE-family HTH domain
MIERLSELTFASRLRECRNRKGFSAAELSRRLGVHQSHVSRLENGERSPSAPMLTALRRALEPEPTEFDFWLHLVEKARLNGLSTHTANRHGPRPGGAPHATVTVDPAQLGVTPHELTLPSRISVQSIVPSLLALLDASGSPEGFREVGAPLKLRNGDLIVGDIVVGSSTGVEIPFDYEADVGTVHTHPPGPENRSIPPSAVDIQTALLEGEKLLIVASANTIWLALNFNSSDMRHRTTDAIFHEYIRAFYFCALKNHKPKPDLLSDALLEGARAAMRCAGFALYRGELHDGDLRLIATTERYS